MSSFTLQEYRIQREYRENVRKEYLKRFQLVKQKIPSNCFNARSLARTQPNQHQRASPLKPIQNKIPRGQIMTQNQSSLLKQKELSKQLQQNELLKQQLQSIQAQQRKRLVQFKQQISTIKETYIDEIKRLSVVSQKSKRQTDEKMTKIEEQMKKAISKNEQIKKVNEQMAKQLQQNNVTMGSYATQIKNEYSDKLNQFQKIFNSSNDKVQQMEKQFNEEEFVNNALGNQELLKSIQQNASKSYQAVKILQDYRQLFAGKSQILKEINSNIGMKQTQLSKIGELEEKMKTIFEKMNAEKMIYVQENQKMTEELVQIKELIIGFVSQAQGADNDQQNLE